VDRTPPPAEKRSVLRPRRRTLQDFPCSFGTNCGHPDCAENELNACRYLAVYREHLAYKRCARLLGIFYRRMMAVALPSQWIAVRWMRFKGLIRSALREAGL